MVRFRVIVYVRPRCRVNIISRVSFRIRIRTWIRVRVLIRVIVSVLPRLGLGLK